MVSRMHVSYGFHCGFTLGWFAAPSSPHAEIPGWGQAGMPSQGDREMLKEIRTNLWLQQVAVALGYALAYFLLRQITISHWVLLAGFRLSILLLAPYRYWPALLIGEVGSLAYISIDCSPEYGWLWGVFFIVPPMLFSMPLVYWCRGRYRLFPAKATPNINVLLVCTLAVSVVWAAMNTGTLFLMRLPPGVVPHPGVAGRYFIGNYLGVLTIVPLVLWMREELLTHGVRQLWKRLSESSLVMDVVCLLLPSMALLVWLALGTTGPESHEARIAMFLPVMWLALRHGWHGAAVGGTGASVAVILAMPFHRDSETLQVQVFIAFVITTMLLLGGRITVLHEREERQKGDARLAFAVAQRNAYLGELQLRQTSYALEQISGAVQTSYAQLLGRLRCLLPSGDERSYYRQAAAMQHEMYRLADALYPLAWREHGLSAALREGAMPRALDEAGIAYWCQADDRKLEDISNSVHLALYRLTCEAVALACAKCDINRIRVRLRSGTFDGHRWALLCVDSHVDYQRLGLVRWEGLQPALGASGLGLGALRDRAAVFGGKVRVRSLGEGRRISIMVLDADIA